MHYYQTASQYTRKYFWHPILNVYLSLQTRRLNWALKLALHTTAPYQIVLGASGTAFPNWISTEMTVLNVLKSSDWEKYFEKNSISALLAEHVWEHLTSSEGELAARNCYAYLKPGGHLRIAVPDGLFPDQSYIDHVKPSGIGEDAVDHKVLYTYPQLDDLLTKVGFTIKLLEYFDEAGQFHSQPWDPADGMVQRSRRFDPRNTTGLHYTSLIIDAIK